MARLRCDDDTRDRLRRLKVGTETFDDVLNKLADQWEEQHDGQF